MTVILLFLLFLGIELVYFKVADRLNIIDKPNLRSSHSVITLRGGGVIFPISLLAYFICFGFSYPYFLIGILAISIISFADDLKHQSPLLRVSIHLIAVLLMLWQAGIFSLPAYFILMALVLSIGVINAWNFMDGINGITAGYALVVLASLYFLNGQVNFVDPLYLKCLMLAVLVFGLFNFRKKARCFAGDVGSVSVAFSLIFPAILLIKATGNFLFILFFALYGVDTVLTILHRLYKRENIFEAHRQHLFQYLANEAKLSHIAVSSIYMAGQLLISSIVVYTWKHYGAGTQMLMAFVLLAALTVMHTVIKFKIISRTEVAAKNG